MFKTLPALLRLNTRIKGYSFGLDKDKASTLVYYNVYKYKVRVLKLCNKRSNSVRRIYQCPKCLALGKVQNGILFVSKHDIKCKPDDRMDFQAKQALLLQEKNTMEKIAPYSVTLDKNNAANENVLKVPQLNVITPHRDNSDTNVNQMSKNIQQVERMVDNTDHATWFQTVSSVDKTASLVTKNKLEVSKNVSQQDKSSVNLKVKKHVTFNVSDSDHESISPSLDPKQLLITTKDNLLSNGFNSTLSTRAPTILRRCKSIQTRTFKPIIRRTNRGTFKAGPFRTPILQSRLLSRQKSQSFDSSYMIRSSTQSQSVTSKSRLDLNKVSFTHKMATTNCRNTRAESVSPNFLPNKKLPDFETPVALCRFTRSQSVIPGSLPIESVSNSETPISSRRFTRSQSVIPGSLPIKSVSNSETPISSRRFTRSQSVIPGSLPIKSVSNSEMPISSRRFTRSQSVILGSLPIESVSNSETPISSRRFTRSQSVILGSLPIESVSNSETPISSRRFTRSQSVIPGSLPIKSVSNSEMPISSRRFTRSQSVIPGSLPIKSVSNSETPIVLRRSMRIQSSNPIAVRNKNSSSQRAKKALAQLREGNIAECDQSLSGPVNIQRRNSLKALRNRGDRSLSPKPTCLSLHAKVKGAKGSSNGKVSKVQVLLDDSDDETSLDDEFSQKGFTIVPATLEDQAVYVRHLKAHWKDGAPVRYMSPSVRVQKLWRAVFGLDSRFFIFRPQQIVENLLAVKIKPTTLQKPMDSDSIDVHYFYKAISRQVLASEIYWQKIYVFLYEGICTGHIEPAFYAKYNRACIIAKERSNCLASSCELNHPPPGEMELNALGALLRCRIFYYYKNGWIDVSQFRAVDAVGKEFPADRPCLAFTYHRQQLEPIFNF